MAYTFSTPIDIGSTGLTLKGTLIDTSGTVHATLRNLACSELADGFYQFSSLLIPDGYRGGVYFHTGTYSTGLGDIDILTAAELAPQITENCDVKVSSLGGMGTGPFSITVTVTDGTDPLQNVIVALFDGATLAGRLSTDASGNATFSLAAGSYTVNAYKGGYTYAPETRTVTGNQSGTLVDDIEMTATGGVTPPSNPLLCRLYGYFLLPSGLPAEDVKVDVTLVSNRPVETSAGSPIAYTTVSENTDSLGYVEIDVIRSDELSQTTTYTIQCQPAGITIPNVSLTTSTQDISDLIS